MVELLAAPERFRDQHVRVIGYATLEFEGSAVYLHEEDYRQAITRNAIWLDVQPSESTRLARPGYAIVEGRYVPDRHGHMGLFSATLTQVDRLSPWPGRQLATP